MEDSDSDGCVSDFFYEHSRLTSSSPLSGNSSNKAYTPDSSGVSSQNLEDMLSLSQLDLEEKEPLEIYPFANVTPRTMPVSPHCILEEEFSSNPWAMLVATIFLTKTSGKTARPHMRSFFDRYPTPYHVLDDCPASLEAYFETLGLKKRGLMIWKLTYQFLSSKWRRASDLCGVGKYGEDAYRIFFMGHTDLDPGDRYLRLYLDWLRGHTQFIEDHGVVDCECIIEDPVLKYYKITLRDGG